MVTRKNYFLVAAALACLGGYVLQPAFLAYAATTPRTTSANRALSVQENTAASNEIPLTLYGYSRSVRLSGTDAKTIVDIPVYPGLTPERLTLTLVPTPNIRQGFVSFENENRTFFTVSFPAPTTTIEVPLEGLRAKDNVVTIIINGIFIADDDTCSAFRSRWVDVSDMSVVVAGVPEPPTTLARFFSPTLQRLSIYIGQDPTPELITAALRLATYAEKMAVNKALDVSIYPSFVTPSTTFNDPYARTVVLSPGGERIVRLVSNPEGWPYLYVTAAPGGWIETITPLIDGATSDLLQVDEIKVRRAERTLSPATSSLTFEQLGAPLTRLQGVGEIRSSLAVPQTAFGRLLADVTVRLRGMASVLQQDGVGRIDTFFNNQLVDSYRIPEVGGSIERDIPIKNNVLQRNNQLDMVLTYTPPGGNCRVGLHNMVLDITGNSSVSGTSSALIAPQFDRFPQILFPTFDLVLEQPSKDVLTAAAKLLTMWQRLSPAVPLNPRVVWLSNYEPRGVPSVIIAPRPEKLPNLDYFLHPDTFHLNEVGLSEDLVTARPFAVMQTFLHRETPMLVLSAHAWPQGINAPLDALLQDEGWYDARGNIMVVTRRNERGFADLKQLRTLPLRYGFWGDGSALDDRQRRIYLWIGVGIAAGIVGVTAFLGFTYRYRQRKKKVSAE